MSDAGFPSVRVKEENSQTSMVSSSDQKLVKIKRSEESDTVACCFTDGIVELFSRQTCDSFEVKVDSKEAVSDLLWFDERRLLCSQSNTVSLYDTEKKKTVSEFIGHSSTVFTVAKNVYNNLIASAGQDNTIILWDVRGRRPVNMIMAHSRSITSLAFSKDSMNIVSCGADGFTRVFSTHTGLCRCTLNSDTTSIPAFVKFADNNQFLLVDTLANRIQLWDWHQLELRQTYLEVQNDSAYHESFFLRDKQTAKQRWVLGLSDANEILLWDIITGQQVFKQQVAYDHPLKLYQHDGDQNNGFYLYGNDSHEIFKYSIDITLPTSANK